MAAGWGVLRLMGRDLGGTKTWCCVVADIWEEDVERTGFREGRVCYDYWV